MEHCTWQERAVQIGMGPVTEVARYQNWQFLNFFQVVFTRVAQPLAAESHARSYSHGLGFFGCLIPGYPHTYTHSGGNIDRWITGMCCYHRSAILWAVGMRESTASLVFSNFFSDMQRPS